MHSRRQEDYFFDMKATIGVLFVHGMGSHEKTYANQFIKKLKAQQARNGIPSHAVAYESAFWHKSLQAVQDQRFQELRQSSLRWNNLRRFAISCLGDVVSYQGVPNRPNPIYHQVHAAIHEHIIRLRSKLVDDDSPLVVIGSSLGTVIMSNYIWDRRAASLRRDEDPLAKTGFERLDSLCGFMTMGSPLPLFSLHIEKSEDIKSISLGHSRLDASIPHRWLNFYDPDDVLGFPLQPISPSYKSAVTEDVKVNVGGLFSSLTPLSHLGYMGKGNRNVVRRVGDYLEEIWDAVGNIVPA